jgi:hypothetical protein
MYLPKEALPCQNYVKNDGVVAFPHPWDKQMEANSGKSRHFQLDFSPRMQCFSPRVQSYNQSSQVHQLGRARSPELEKEFCRRLVINPNELNRRP